MKGISLLASLMAVLMLSSCSAASGGGSAFASSISGTEGEPLPGGAVESKLIQANNAFALSLTKMLGDDWTGVFSPLSISMVLQLTMNGADQLARTAMEQALKTQMGQDEINLNNGRLLNKLNSAGSVRMANAVFANKAGTVNKEFISIAADFYRAGIGNLDFSDKQKTLRIINDWLKDNTDGRIKDMVKEISNDSMMFLINAVTFKSNWLSPFDPKKTEKADFYGLNEKTVVEMMSKTGSMSYYQAENGQIALLPYADKSCFMAVMLPEEGVSPADFIQAFDYQWNKCESAYGTLNMPKARLETNLDLNGILKDMGMGDAFIDGDGSFPSLITANDGRGSAAINNVMHGAAITIDENGTEASAGTVVDMAVRSMAPGYPFTIQCDRPYAMMIVHLETEAVLFTAIVSDLGIPAA